MHSRHGGIVYPASWGMKAQQVREPMSLADAASFIAELEAERRTKEPFLGRDQASPLLTTYEKKPKCARLTPEMFLVVVKAGIPSVHQPPNFVDHNILAAANFPAAKFPAATFVALIVPAVQGLPPHVAVAIPEA